VTLCRAPRDEDIPVLAALRNDLPTQYALLAVPRPNSDADVRAWVDRRVGDPAALFFVIANGDDEAVGFTQVVGIDDHSRHGSFGIAIAPAERGRGHARAAIEQLFGIVRGTGRIDKLMLHVATDNVHAHVLYRSLGFRDVGLLQRHYRGPHQWHDVAVMERFLGGTP
jgi:RimJ/RimL family protein N-acetyltransferase